MEAKKFSLYEHHSMINPNIQVSYKGPIDERILSIIGNYIELVVDDPVVSKKIFKIFIELAQNISFYSAEKSRLGDKKSEIGAGTIVIGDFKEYYTFVTGNNVKNADIIPLIEKCEIINSLDREGLRKYKREQRKLPPGRMGGAHIGLIQVALTSANPLDIEVQPVDDKHSFFSIAVRIDKQKETDKNTGE